MCLSYGPVRYLGSAPHRHRRAPSGLTPAPSPSASRCWDCRSFAAHCLPQIREPPLSLRAEVRDEVPPLGRGPGLTRITRHPLILQTGPWGWRTRCFSHLLPSQLRPHTHHAPSAHPAESFHVSGTRCSRVDGAPRLVISTILSAADGLGCSAGLCAPSTTLWLQVPVQYALASPFEPPSAGPRRRQYVGKADHDTRRASLPAHRSAHRHAATLLSQVGTVTRTGMNFDFYRDTSFAGSWCRGGRAADPRRCQGGCRGCCLHPRRVPHPRRQSQSLCIRVSRCLAWPGAFSHLHVTFTHTRCPFSGGSVRRRLRSRLDPPPPATRRWPGAAVEWSTTDAVGGALTF